MCSIATILHADLDAFYASVEQRDEASLRGRPMAVGGGGVLAASYPARAAGVRTGMGLGLARRACPGLVVVPPRMEAYSEASAKVMAIFGDTTPLVEPLSIDEAFLDVGGLARLSGTPTNIARRLRARVADEVGLPLSVGIARTKFLAKVASGVSKPDGLLLVKPADELAFLRPLPIRQLWGVGPATEERLREVGISTVAEVADAAPSLLAAAVGAGSAKRLRDLAHNRDVRRVTPGKRRSSIGAQRAVRAAQRTPDEVAAIFLELLDRVTGRLRDGDRVGRTLTMKFRYGDFSTATRSITTPLASSSTATFLNMGMHLLADARNEVAERRLSLLGITISQLEPAHAVQQTLHFGPEGGEHLDATLDAIRRRFGSHSIGRTVLVNASRGVEMPLLVDPGSEQSEAGGR